MAASKNELIDVEEYVTTLPPKLEWIVDGVLPVGGVSMIAAAPKAGKSYCVLGMLMAVSQGKPWFGCATNETRCLYVDGEVGGDELWRRLYRLAQGLGEGNDFSDHRLLLTSKRVDLTTKESLDFLAESITTQGIGLLVLDPISKMHLGSDANEVDAKTVLANLDELRRQTGVTLLLVNHFSRGAAKRKNAGDRYYGSVRWAGDAVSLLELDKRADDLLVLSHTDCRYSRPIEPITVKVEITEELARFTEVAGEVRERLVGESALEWLIGYLAEFCTADGTYDWVPKSGIVEDGAARGLNLTAIDRALKSALEDPASVERQTRGKAAYFRLL